MNCPGCAAPMPQQILAAHMGRSVTVDFCLACQALWFDGYESLQLTPASTLRLFAVIGGGVPSGQDGAASAPASGRLFETARCPRCDLRLQAVEDMQRATRFRYRKCPHGHGRFITFFDFLREKNFIKPLSAEQLAELRARVTTVNCSNCGAPIDLMRASSCEHCGSALSMLDLQHASALIEQLRTADTQPHTGSEQKSIDPALALDLLRARRQTERIMDEATFGASWYGDAGSAGTVGASLRALSRWLTGTERG